MSQYDAPAEDALIGCTVDASPTTPADDADAPPTKFTAAVYGLIVLLGTLAAMGPLAIDMYLPAFPTIATELGTTESSLQRTLATYFVGLAFGQLIYGPASDRWGRKGPLYVGLGLFAIASIGCAMATSLNGLATLRLVQALGGCAEMVIARAIVRDRFSPRDGIRVFSGLVLVMGVAPIAAPLMGGWIVGHWGWRALFGVLAGFSVVVLAIVATLLPESLPRERRIREDLRGMARVYGGLLLDRPFMARAVALGVMTAGLFAYVGGSPLVFMKLFGIPKETFGWYFGANAAGLIGAAQVNGQLMRRGFDPRRVLRIALALATVGGIAMVIGATTGIGGFWGVYLPIFACMTCTGFVFPNATALSMAAHGRHAGYASALLGSVQFAVSGFAGFVQSAVTGDRVSAVPMAAMIAGCAALALIVETLGTGARSTTDAHATDAVELAH